MSFELIEDDNVEFETKKRDYTNRVTGPRPRSEEQKPWDAAFEKARDGDGILRVQILPDDAEDARKRVKSAARYNNLGVTEGLPKQGKKEGTVILMWKIRPIKARKSQSQSSEE